MMMSQDIKECKRNVRHYESELTLQKKILKDYEKEIEHILRKTPLTFEDFTVLQGCAGPRIRVPQRSLAAGRARSPD